MDSTDKERLTTRLKEAETELKQVSGTLAKLMGLHGGKQREPASLNQAKERKRQLQFEIDDLKEGLSYIAGAITASEYRERYTRLYADLARQRETEAAFFRRLDTVMGALNEVQASTANFKKAVDGFGEIKNPLTELHAIVGNLGDVNYKRFFSSGEILPDTDRNVDFLNEILNRYFVKIPKIEHDIEAVVQKADLNINLMRRQCEHLVDIAKPKRPTRISRGMVSTRKSSQPTHRPGMLYQRQTPRTGGDKPQHQQAAV